MEELAKSILKNGMEVNCLKSWEASNAAQSYYDHVQIYFGGIVKINKGDTILDIGANIGMYAISIYERYGNKVNIFAFEPIPEIYQVLKANMEHFSKETLIPVPKGVSNRSGIAEFTYYNSAPSFSTLYPELQQEEIIDELLQYYDSLEQAGRLDEWPSNIQDTIIKIQSNDNLSEEKKARAIKMESMIAVKNSFHAQKVECELTTVSDIILDYGLDKIDVLKLHVEHSEWDILQGIEAADWDKIKQMVIQIEGTDSVERIKKLLSQHDFTRVEAVVQEDIAAFNTTIVYAVK